MANKKTQSDISTELRELIAVTAEETASKIYNENISGQVNYYRIIERLLYNYNKLKALVENEKEYIAVELKGKSKSIVSFSSCGGGYKSQDEIIEEIEKQKQISYKRTAANFEEVEKVISLFEDRKEFAVIRMYYFNEDAEGNQREEALPQYTWEEVAHELSRMGVLKDSKTARRWRNNIINDMAVCMFGKPAAISTGVFRSKII